MTVEGKQEDDGSVTVKFPEKFIRRLVGPNVIAMILGAGIVSGASLLKPHEGDSTEVKEAIVRVRNLEASHEKVAATHERMATTLEKMSDKLAAKEELLIRVDTRLLAVEKKLDKIDNKMP
jgi:hypothetical protein